jgi:hypothetical protein
VSQSVNPSRSLPVPVHLFSFSPSHRPLTCSCLLPLEVHNRETEWASSLFSLASVYPSQRPAFPNRGLPGGATSVRKLGAPRVPNFPSSSVRRSGSLTPGKHLLIHFTSNPKSRSTRLNRLPGRAWRGLLEFSVVRAVD